MAQKKAIMMPIPIPNPLGGFGCVAGHGMPQISAWQQEPARGMGPVMPT